MTLKDNLETLQVKSCVTLLKKTQYTLNASVIDTHIVKS